MEVLGCTKLSFTMVGNASDIGCFAVKSLFSTALMRRCIYKLIDIAYPRVSSACLNVDVLMGVCVLL